MDLMRGGVSKQPIHLAGDGLDIDRYAFPSAKTTVMSTRFLVPQG